MEVTWTRLQSRLHHGLIYYGTTHARTCPRRDVQHIAAVFKLRRAQSREGVAEATLPRGEGKQPEPQSVYKGSSERARNERVTLSDRCARAKTRVGPHKKK